MSYDENSKGNKDRSTVLAESLVPHLQAHLARIDTLHAEYRLFGGGLVPMPDALPRKYPSSASSFTWQFVFPSAIMRHWGQSRRPVRGHVSDETIQRAFNAATPGHKPYKH